MDQAVADDQNKKIDDKKRGFKFRHFLASFFWLEIFGYATPIGPIWAAFVLLRGIGQARRRRLLINSCLFLSALVLSLCGYRLNIQLLSPERVGDAKTFYLFNIGMPTLTLPPKVADILKADSYYDVKYNKQIIFSFESWWSYDWKRCRSAHQNALQWAGNMISVVRLLQIDSLYFMTKTGRPKFSVPPKKIFIYLPLSHFHDDIISAGAPMAYFDHKDTPMELTPLARIPDALLLIPNIIGGRTNLLAAIFLYYLPNDLVATILPTPTSGQRQFQIGSYSGFHSRVPEVVKKSRDHKMVPLALNQYVFSLGQGILYNGTVESKNDTIVFEVYCLPKDEPLVQKIMTDFLQSVKTLPVPPPRQISPEKTPAVQKGSGQAQGPESAETHYDQSRRYLSEQQYDSAIKSANKAIELKPDYIDAYLLRGNIYLEQKKKINEAIADFNRAISLAPNYAFAYFSRGTAYGDLGQLKLALEDYEKACAIGDPQACSSAADIRYKLEAQAVVSRRPKEPPWGLKFTEMPEHIQLQLGIRMMYPGSHNKEGYGYTCGGGGLNKKGTEMVRCCDENTAGRIKECEYELPQHLTLIGKEIGTSDIEVVQWDGMFKDVLDIKVTILPYKKDKQEPKSRRRGRK
ncbi:MAG: tetratricopeptide repeat protein [Elusimicrobia bacterium]|nr:tetratricopeptide repeat protein [Elusimicrobiota bacterium]